MVKITILLVLIGFVLFMTKYTSRYVHVKVEDHPFARKGYILEHRLVMEKKIGRYLTPVEVVHHLDMDKTNNNINNLVLCADRREHNQKYHREITKAYWVKKGDAPLNPKNGKDMPCLECGTPFYAAKSDLTRKKTCSKLCSHNRLSRLRKGSKGGGFTALNYATN